MQVVYGFIYYFEVFMVCCIVALSVFLLPPARRLLVKFWKQYQGILDNDVVRYAKLLIFGIIGLILIQSIYTYTLLNAHFSNQSTHIERKLGGFQNIDLMIPRGNNKEGYLLALKEFREFYLAERNIMLTISAVFAFFVFQRLFYNIRRYSEEQQAVEALVQPKKRQ